MSHYVLKQLSFIRGLGVNVAKEMSAEQVLKVPTGFNNNILWNLGHMYLVLEKFSFGMMGEPMELPESYQALFGKGSKPELWEGEVPSLEELLEKMTLQTQRIEEQLGSRMNEALKSPYVTSTGLEINRLKEILSFCLYHEGLHIEAMKDLKKFV